MKLLVAYPPDQRRPLLLRALEAAEMQPTPASHLAAAMQMFGPGVSLFTGSLFTTPSGPAFDIAIIYDRLGVDDHVPMTDDKPFDPARQLFVSTGLRNVTGIIARTGVLTPSWVSAFGDAPSFDADDPLRTLEPAFRQVLAMKRRPRLLVT